MHSAWYGNVLCIYVYLSFFSRNTEGVTDVDEASDECVDIVVQYDFGWNKRGNGHCYNSHSGKYPCMLRTSALWMDVKFPFL